MKDVTNVLVVLFLIVGAGLVYAGKGECVSPDPIVTNEITHLYYPESGRLRYTYDSRTTDYPNQYCEGVEGQCDTESVEEATALHISIYRWYYNDTDDDATKLEDSEYQTYTYGGRVLCDDGTLITR